MTEKKCIYCGRGISDGVNLNISHIIPDALTNYKGHLNKNANVCTTDHNSKFGETFESGIINELAQLRNILGIKNKDGNLPQYLAKIRVNEVEYRKKIVSKKDFFEMQRICSGSDGKAGYKIGRLTDLEKITHGDIEKIEFLDFNTSDISIDVSPDVDLFNSIDMLRLVAKISFEWFCKEMNIDNKLDEFETIIHFIETGENTDLVEIVNDDLFYKAIHTRVQLSSHVIGYYTETDNTIYGLVSLFGLVIYKVQLGKNHIYDEDIRTINLTEIRVDGSTDSFPVCPIANGSTISSLKPNNPTTKKVVFYILKTYYPKVINTQLLSLRSLYPTVKEIEGILNIENQNLIHDYLIGYRDERLLITTYTLYKIASSAYNNTLNFSDNLELILGIDSTQILTLDINELATYLKNEFLIGTLLPKLVVGISIFNTSYKKEICV